MPALSISALEGKAAPRMGEIDDRKIDSRGGEIRPNEYD